MRLDELEALIRKAVFRFDSTGVMDAIEKYRDEELLKLRDEVERLTKLVAQYEAVPVEAMEEENAKLREALEWIVLCANDPFLMREHARAILGDE